MWPRRDIFQRQEKSLADLVESPLEVLGLDEGISAVVGAGRLMPGMHLTSEKSHVRTLCLFLCLCT